MAIQRGIGKYAEAVGIPAVVTGRKSPKKRRKKGHTRGQVVLIQEKNPSKRIDLRMVCLIVVWAEYCKALPTPLEDGTNAVNAVLLHLLQDEVFKRILASVRAYYY